MFPYERPTRHPNHQSSHSDIHACMHTYITPLSFRAPFHHKPHQRSPNKTPYPRRITLCHTPSKSPTRLSTSMSNLSKRFLFFFLPSFPSTLHIPPQDLSRQISPQRLSRIISPLIRDTSLYSPLCFCLLQFRNIFFIFPHIRCVLSLTWMMTN